VDAQPVLCDGLKQLIDGQPDLICVGVANNLLDAKQLVEERKPDLMVLDLRFRAATRSISSKHWRSNILK
jgi:DNA-binding NarL/FixJ family response regulator